MKIHSDTLTNRHILDAASLARVEFGRFNNKGSRSRKFGFDITLTGESRRRPNDQGESARYNLYAATWDQWGVFLAALYAIDPNMVTPNYKDAEDFAFKTCDRFGAPEVVMTSEGYASVFKSYGWPEDAHGDHTFRYAGIPYTQVCTKCSAEQRWQ